VGGYETFLAGKVEPFLRDHSGRAKILMVILESGHLTLSGGQFDWGGRLLKGNGGVQRFPQAGRKSAVECKGIRELDCKTYKSSRGESRP
jgi:hypothetical protein